MTATDLNPAQRKRLAEGIAQRYAYLVKLRQRMDRLGFAPDHPLYAKVRNVETAMHDLRVFTHYLSVHQR